MEKVKFELSQHPQRWVKSGLVCMIFGDDETVRRSSSLVGSQYAHRTGAWVTWLDCLNKDGNSFHLSLPAFTRESVWRKWCLNTLTSGKTYREVWCWMKEEKPKIRQSTQPITTFRIKTPAHTMLMRQLWILSKEKPRSEWMERGRLNVPDKREASVVPHILVMTFWHFWTAFCSRAVRMLGPLGGDLC